MEKNGSALWKGFFSVGKSILNSLEFLMKLNNKRKAGWACEELRVRVDGNVSGCEV